MKYDPEKHHRHSIRLKGYDYSQAGAYYVTICTHKKECLFGNVVDGKMELTRIGTIAGECWKAIPKHFPNVTLDVFVVMPNHVHGVVMIRRDTACRVPTMGEFSKPVPGSLPTVIRSYKSAVTKRINELRNTLSSRVWQPNYYEHVIRGEADLNEVREYIINNALKWDLDKENPANLGKR